MGAQWKTKLKEAANHSKGRIFTKLAREIMVAARGGADPDMNSRLRLAVDQAKKASMPKETLERAIKKGAGLLDEGVTFEKLTYEGFAPHQVPIIVECLTDNVNRTISNVRTLFRKGLMGASGSVAWNFDYLGIIEATPKTPDADPEVAAIEAGARDLEPGEEGASVFLTDPVDLDAVCRALPNFGFVVQTAELGYRSKSPIKLDDAQRAEVEAFLEAMDADDDVQNVYAALAD